MHSLSETNKIQFNITNLPSSKGLAEGNEVFLWHVDCDRLFVAVEVLLLAEHVNTRANVKPNLVEPLHVEAVSLILEFTNHLIIS